MSQLLGPLLPGGGQTINPRAVWVPDSMSKECMVCGQRFTAFNRKHHCRQCGRVVCSTCSPHRVQLDGPAEGKPERVCSGCVKEVTTVKSKGQSASQWPDVFCLTLSCPPSPSGSPEQNPKPPPGTISHTSCVVLLISPSPSPLSPPLLTTTCTCYMYIIFLSC